MSGSDAIASPAGAASAPAVPPKIPDTIDAALAENQSLRNQVAQLQAAQEAMRRNEQRYAGILDAQETLIVRGDPNNRITYMNEAYARAFGLKLGETYFMRVHPEDMAATERALEQLRVPPYTCSVEQRCLIGGQWRWIHWQDSVVRDDAGKIVEIQGVGFDITERKRAEEALRVSEARFRTLVEQSPLAVQVFSTDGRPLQINSAASELWGVPQSAFLPYNILEDRQLVEIGIMPRVLAAYRGEAALLPPNRYEIRHGEKPGQIRWTRGVIYPTKDDSGAVREIVIVHEDITEQMMAREALRDSEDRYRTVVNSIREVIFQLDTAARFTLLNPAWTELTGVAVEGALGTPFFDYLLAEDRPRARGAFDSLIDGTLASHRRESCFHHRDGSYRWLEVHAHPIRDAGGAIIGVSGTFNDVTERRLAGEALRESEVQSKQAAEFNRRLLLELDHRVRNNLSGLLGLLSMMRQKMTDVSAFAGAIEARIRAMAHVHQLLAESHGSAMDLSQLAKSLLEAMGGMAHYAISVSVEGPPTFVPERQVLPLTMILLEWLTNSCKYGAHSSPTGRVEIRWQGWDGGEGQGVELTWRESGGPPISQPVSPSIGTELVRGLAVRELRGECLLNFAPEGVYHMLRFCPGETSVARATE